MMNKLLIATTNSAKFDEYRLLLTEYHLDLVSLREVGIDDQAPEEGDTFLANARVKALFYFERSSIATLADDGGLEVDALGGAPGVRSHRWLGDKVADDRTLAEEVIRRMVGVETNRRTARLRAATVLIYGYDNAVHEAVAEAALDGMIADRCFAEVRQGFPYRSVLFLPDRARYLLELSDAEAAQLSQRHTLVEKLANHLARLASVGDYTLEAKPSQS